MRREKTIIQLYFATPISVFIGLPFIVVFEIKGSLKIRFPAFIFLNVKFTQEQRYVTRK